MAALILHIRNSRCREKALRHVGADRATPTSQGSDEGNRMNTEWDCIYIGRKPQEYTNVISCIYGKNECYNSSKVTGLLKTNFSRTSTHFDVDLNDYTKDLVVLPKLIIGDKENLTLLWKSHPAHPSNCLLSCISLVWTPVMMTNMTTQRISNSFSTAL